MRAPVAAIVAELFPATKMADRYGRMVASGFCRSVCGHRGKVSGQRDTLIKITVKRFLIGDYAIAQAFLCISYFFSNSFNFGSWISFSHLGLFLGAACSRRSRRL
jgi:hypothetical protein